MEAGASGVRVARGATGSTFGALTAVSGSTGAVIALAVQDVDADGRADLLLGTASGLVVRRSTTTPTGALQLGAASDPLTSAAPTAVAVGDLDGTGPVDLVVAGSSGQPLLLRGGAPAPTGFAAGTPVGAVDLDVPPGAFLGLTGRGVVLTLGGQSLTGDLEFQQVTVGGVRTVTVDVENLTIPLPGLTLPPQTGQIVLRPGGAALVVGFSFPESAPLSLPGGVTLAGAVRLELNTGSAAVTVATSGGPVTLPAGPYLRLAGTDLRLVLGDAVELRGSIVVQRATSATGELRTVLAAQGASVVLGGTTVLEDVRGILVLSPAGLAAEVGGRLALGFLPSSVVVEGSFLLSVNRRAAAVTETVTVGGQQVVLDLPAGPFAQVAGTGVRLTVGGLALTADVAFRREGTLTVVALSGAGLELGGATPVVRLSGGSGLLVLGTGGLAGRFGGTVQLLVPGVSLTGSLQVELNTATTAVTIAPFTVGTTTYGGGDPIAPGLVLAGSAALTVAGQALAGTVRLAQTGTGATRRVRLDITALTAFLGAPDGSVGLRLTTPSTAGITVLLTPAGVAVDGTVSVALVGIPTSAFSLTSPTVRLQLNTTRAAVTEDGLDLPAGPFVRVQIGTLAAGGGLDPVTLTVAGQSLTALLSVERAPTPGADGALGTADDGSVLRIAASRVGLTIGSGSTSFVLSDGTALLVLGGGGVAGRITARAALTLGGPTVSVDEVAVALNQRATDVAESFALGGETVALVLPAGPYLRLALTGVSVDLGGVLVRTDLVLERRTSGTPAATVTTLTVANLEAALGDGGAPVLRLTDGTGRFVLAPSGMAGRVSVRVALDVPGVTLTGTFGLRLGTGTTAIDVAEEGAPADLVPPGLLLEGTGVELGVGGQRLTGSLTVERTATALVIGTDLLLRLGDGTTTLVEAELDGVLVVSPGGLAGRFDVQLALAEPLRSVVDLRGLSARIEVNTGTAAVDRTVTVAGSPRRVQVDAGPRFRIQLGQVGAPVTIAVGGQSLEGVFLFEQSTTGSGRRTVRLAFTEVALFLGDDPTPTSPGSGDETGFRLTQGRGAFLLLPGGVAGEVSGTVGLVGLTGFALDARVTLRVNRTPAAVHDVVRFDGVDVATTTDGTATTAEVQQVTVTQVAGTFALGFDRDGDGRLSAAEVSAPVAVGAAAADLQAALDALLGAGAVTVTGGGSDPYTVTWSAHGPRRALQGGVRVLALPAGPYLRFEATQVVAQLGGFTLTADLAVEQVPDPRAAGTTRTRIGLAGGRLLDGSSELLTGLTGALVLVPSGTYGAGGVAGVLRGTGGADAGTALAGKTVEAEFNTSRRDFRTADPQPAGTGPESIRVGDSVVVVDVAPATATRAAYEVAVRGLAFEFGDFLEVRGDVVLGPDGRFSGENLEVFVGSGPSQRDGVPNPDAVGLLLTSGEVRVLKPSGAAGYALYAAGRLQLLGLRGLEVSGTVVISLNTLTTVASFTTSTGTVTVQPGTFSITVGDLRLGVAGVLLVTGTLDVRRQPNGDLDLALGGASVEVAVGGTGVVRLGGYATFSITRATGLRLGTFAVDAFELFPTLPAGLPVVLPSGSPAPSGPTPSAVRPRLAPNADLASPLRGAVVPIVDFNGLGALEVEFVSRNLTATGERARIDAATVLDATTGATTGAGAPEFRVFLDGVDVTAQLQVAAVPTAVEGRPGRYRYAFSGALPGPGVVEVRFTAGSVVDETGMALAAETETFFVVATAGQKPRPTAVLASPVSGETLTAAALNARRYLDVTFVSHDGTPVNKASIEDAGPEFLLRGSGLNDVLLDAGGAPVTVGLPLLVSGREPGATTVTYRYFLKNRTVGTRLAPAPDLFKAGDVEVVVAGTDAQPAFRTEAFVAGPTTDLSGRSTAGLVQAFTLSATAPGAATTTQQRTLGPLTLQGPSIGIADVGFADGMLILTIALDVQLASLAFGRPAGAPAAPAGTATPQSTSGVRADLVGVRGTFDLAVDALGLLGGTVRIAPTGAWSLRVASLEAEVPGVAKLTAEGVVVRYDPEHDPATGPQELVRVASASITFPGLGLTGSLRPFDPSAGRNVDLAEGETRPGIVPGLVIYDDGFALGTAELAYGLPPLPAGTVADPANALTSTAPGATPQDRDISLFGILVLDDLRVKVSGLRVRFGGSSPAFSGSISIATGGARLFPGRPVSATLTDRQTADDVNLDGTPNTEAFSATVEFAPDGTFKAFRLSVDTLEVKLGQFVTLTARGFALNTGARADEFLADFLSVGATVRVGGLEITGEGRNFGFLGDGTFKTKNGFGVFLQVGAAAGSSFKWPEFLPVRIDAIGIEWADIERAPADFVLVLSASVTGIKGVGGLEFSGSVQGIRIAPALLAAGQFPIIGIDALGVTVKGKMFGGELDAALVGGILKLNSSFGIIGTFDRTTPVAHRVFYLGLQGGFSIAGMAGFTIRLGLSELGPLQVFLNAEVPGGVLIEPTTGLTLNDFSAGVEFFKTLPSIDDPFALRSTAFGLPTSLTADQWLTSLQQQVALQAQRISTGATPSGFAAAFTSPMVITGSARIYSIYTSQAVFNGLVTIKISTDGKFLISGTLNFADNNLSLSGRLYADLSRVSTGDVTVLFLADIPDQVRLLTLYGKLKMGFKNASGQEVAFDVPASDLPPPAAAPTVELAAPTSGGGSVDLGSLPTDHYVDVVVRAAPGADVDWAALLGASGTPAGLTLTTGIGGATAEGATRVLSAPVAVLTVTGDDGTVTAYELQVDGTGVFYRRPVPGSTTGATERVDLRTGDDEPVTTLAEAMRITGSNRLRYRLTGALEAGRTELVVAAGAFRNAATPAGPGAQVAGTTLAFDVTELRVELVEPAAGGGVDVHVLNDRGWIDVTFAVPDGLVIDLASLRDLAPELVLSGPGAGSLAFDSSRAPTVLTALPETGPAAGQDVQLRYYLTGRRGTGAITLAYLPGTWSYVATGLTVTVEDVRADQPPSALVVRFDGVPAGFRIDPASVTDLADELTGIATGKTGWSLRLDPLRAVTAGAGGTFLVPVEVLASPAFTPLASGATDTERAAFVTAVTSTVTASLVAGSVSLLRDADATDPVFAPAPTTAVVTGPFVDVLLAPGQGQALAGLSSQDLTLGGPGRGTAATLAAPPLHLGGGVYRFFLTGAFAPGEVTVSVDPSDVLAGTARGPPAVRTFLVAGASGDLVRDVPATATAPGRIEAVSGMVLSRDAINGQGHLLVRFRGTSGSTIVAGTVDGDELELRGPDGALIALGAPVRVVLTGDDGQPVLTDLWRYSFTGALAGGRYTLVIRAGSVRDTSGTVNQREEEVFTLASSSARLVNPAPGSRTGRDEVNSRGWVDVTFTGADPDSVLDEGAELTLSAPDQTITLVGAPVRLDGDTYRFFFTGHRTGTLTVTPVAGTWRLVSGEVAAVGTAVAESGLDTAGFRARTWFDAVFETVGGATLDITTIDGTELVLSGPGTSGLTRAATRSFVQVDGRTVRYLYTGDLAAGTVTATIAAGSWKDSDGSDGGGGTGSFEVLVPAEAFFIELSGGLVLTLPGLPEDEPLIRLTAEVVLEIDTPRRLFTLTFGGQLELYRLGTVGATAGRFVLDMGDGTTTVPQFWGVASLKTNFSGLEQYGLFLNAEGLLQVNLTGSTKTETLTLKGIGPGGSDLTRTFVLAPGSFVLELTGSAVVRESRTSTTDLVRLQGGFVLRIVTSGPDPRFELFVTAEVSFGSGASQITYGAATGLLVVSPKGVAGSLRVTAGGGLGLPDLGTLFRATGTVTLMFNTTREDITFVLPESFLPLLRPGDPRVVEIYGSAPGLDGGRNPSAPATGEVYVRATVEVRITVGGVVDLTGFIGITAAVDPARGAYLRVDGAVGATVPLLGSLTGTLNLAVFVGATPATTGVVGRVHLTLGSNTIPGLRFNGQFLLEINTFASAQTVQTFEVETAGGVFSGFKRNAAGQLVVTSQQVTVTSGFRLLLAGSLVIGDRLTVEGSVRFTASAGADPLLELVVNGRVELGGVGTLTLTDSGLRVSRAGLVARVQVSLAAGSGLTGLQTSGSGVSVQVFLAVNTTGRSATLGGSTVEPGFVVRIEGTVKLLSIEASGFVEVRAL
ncbi:MAG TPA: VCBS repeat-containing protein, partial [Mycobacteriales bacterium]|nr:VCBS repeat-containing protein [Mycobacteriales bacterium]